MAKNHVLYGESLARGRGGSLTDQLYDVLRQEILKGRWAIGEQLPSYNDLSDACGLSRTPVQKVYTRLEADGYVTRVRQKGVFVKSTTSASNSTLGSIVFAVHADEDLVAKTQSFGFWDLQAMVEDAKRRGFRAEVLRVQAPATVPGPLTISLQQDVLGIVSVVPRNWLIPLIGERDLPVVYLGVDDPFSSPALDGNLFLASYLLTEHFISLQHKAIGLFLAPGLDPDHLQQVALGHRRAMEGVGLRVDEALLEWSATLESVTLKELNAFFTRFSETTAVLCTTGIAANKLVEVADFLGVTIPDQLSIASCQVTDLRYSSDVTFLGAYYNWDVITERCFAILLDHHAKANSEMLRQVFRPHIKVEKSPSVTTAPRRSCPR